MVGNSKMTVFQLTLQSLGEVVRRTQAKLQARAMKVKKQQKKIQRTIGFHFSTINQSTNRQRLEATAAHWKKLSINTFTSYQSGGRWRNHWNTSRQYNNRRQPFLSSIPSSRNWIQATQRTNCRIKEISLQPCVQSPESTKNKNSKINYQKCPSCNQWILGRETSTSRTPMKKKLVKRELSINQETRAASLENCRLGVLIKRSLVRQRLGIK